MVACASKLLPFALLAWTLGASLVHAQSTGAPTPAEIADLSAKLKTLTGTFDKDGDKAVVAPSELIGLVSDLNKVADSMTGKTADSALVTSFLTLLEKISRGTPEQQQNFVAITGVVTIKDKLLELIPAPVVLPDTRLTDAVSKIDGIVKAGEFSATTGKAQAPGLLDIAGKLFGTAREEYVNSLAKKLTDQIPLLDSKTVSDIKADQARRKPLADLDAALQTAIGSSDLKVHIIGAAYGDRFLLESFVKSGKPQTPGAKSRWCNATATMRARCERKGECTLGALASLCGFDPAEFTDPRYKGVIVHYDCRQDSDLGYWTRPTNNVSAYDPIRLSRQSGGDIVFLGSPDAQLACEVTP